MRFIHVHGASDGRDIYINPQYIESFAVHDGKVRICTVGVSDACITIKESLTEIVEMLTEAGEEVKASREVTASLINLAQNYPPDPFDYAEVEDSEEPEPKKETNFTRITKSPEALAEFLGAELSRCPDEMAGKQCNELCIFCWLDQLNKEVEDG